MNSKQAEHDRAVLPRIRELKAEGRSLREIADHLQDEGVPTARRGGQWNHKAVDRILARAEQTQPEEASPPPPPTEQPPVQTEPPPPPAEPPPAPAPQFQKIEEQLGKAEEQLSARIQESEERLGKDVDQMGARVHEKLGTIKSQVDELDTIETQLQKQVAAVRRLSTWLWLRPVAVGVAICLAVGGAGWGYLTWLEARIESQRKTLAEGKQDIERQQATLRELEQQTWGVRYHETQGGKFITWPGHYLRPFKGKDSQPAYAGKWVAKLAEE